MNPRIQELALHAAEYAIELTVKYPELYFPTFTEKFAKLIVRECADLTRWREKDMSAEQRIRLEIYREIKDHFGVKE